jgi:hypothetical protein
MLEFVLARCSGEVGESLVGGEVGGGVVGELGGRLYVFGERALVLGSVFMGAVPNHHLLYIAWF